MRPTTTRIILLLLGALLFATSLAAGPGEPEKSIFDQIHRSEGLIEVSLETDLSQLMADKTSETYFPAVLSSSSKSGKAFRFPVNVRLRGRYRRRVCDFPPLKLQFPEEHLETEGFNPRYRSLKLVTHCLEDKRSGRENVLLEYLAYKLFAQLSENSFRVQLVRITYLDEAGERDPIERFGFIIEDPDQVADRAGGLECEQGCMNPDPATLDQKAATLVAVYQYMIGNADWSLQMMRNLKLITRDAESDDLIVPYDFDFAGMINAGYALPNRNFDQTTIRERVFLGIPVDDPILRWTLNYFKFHRENILDTVTDFKLLPLGVRRDAEKYIQSFFDYLEDLDVNQTTDLYGKLSATNLPYPLPSF